MQPSRDLPQPYLACMGVRAVSSVLEDHMRALHALVKTGQLGVDVIERIRALRIASTALERYSQAVGACDAGTADILARARHLADTYAPDLGKV